jgi:RsiW-degrading membrane proteinase PrsW (M82 family)
MLNYTPLILTIILAYIPSFAWLGFVLSQDVHSEKATDIAKTFILGNFIAVPVILFAVWGQEILDIFMLDLPNIVSNFIFAAFIEEVLKGAFIYWFAISTSRWDEPVDTFIYAATLALGFAGIENFAYVISGSGYDFDTIQQLLILRALSSVIIHIISSFLVTYGLVFYVKYKQKLNGIWLILGGIIFHGLWNIAVDLSSATSNFVVLAFYLLICIPLFVGMIFTVKHLRLQSVK